MKITITCLLLLIVTLVYAETTRDVSGRVHVPREEIQLGVRVSVDNNGNPQLSYVRFDGSFTLYNLTAGTHIVDFYSTNYVIPQIRIDISGKSNRYRAFAMIPSTPANGIEGFGFVQTPITTEPIMHIKPIAPMEYFEKEEPFDPFSMLKNPMVITMIVGLGIAFLAPKLVDPETMKEAQATMSQSESELKNMFSAAVADKKKK